MLRAVKTLLLSSVVAAFSAVWAGAQPYPVGDLNADSNVDFEDLHLLAERWLDPSCLIPGCQADLDGADGVNAVDLALLAENWGLKEVTIVISEFMASNGSKEPLAEGELLDEDGDSSDWIEIHNPTEASVDLSGWYLTNDANNLDQWEFPNGIKLDPGQFLIVFASGKNRITAGAELHTNFKLDIGGEYLALVKSDGFTVVHQYGPQYPQQLTDVSYGLSQYATVLVPAGATASHRVPTVSDANADWAAPGFNDSMWKTGPTGLGFGNSSPGFEVIYYKANTTVANLSTAESVISNPSYRSAVAAETASVINYLDNGGNGNFGGDHPFPGITIGSGVDDFAVLVTGRVLIPQSGDWTFGVNSDDGFGLELTNGTHTLTFSYPDPRAARDTLATFNIPEWGLYELRLVFYERGGNSELELFAAQGSYSSFDPTRFRLVGDVANGGLYVLSFGNEANTDVQQQMQNVNSSMWARIEFEGEEVDFFDSLALRMRYEDGFLAYLNGVEIARGNFAGAPAWNSLADGDRPNELAGEYVDFDLSEFIGELREGTNVLAIHGLNDDRADGEFLILPELVAASNRTVPQYFSSATPGRFNAAGAVSIVADTKFSADRGFYDTPFSVTITSETPGATINYTTDGSAPTETHGYEYMAPVPIQTTTCLRAMAFKPGWMPTDVDTQTYIFLDHVIHQPDYPVGFPTTWGSWPSEYGMDPDVVNHPLYSGTIKEDLKSIPTMSLVMNVEDIFGSTGIYANPNSSGVAWERPGSIEFFDPNGSQQFQVNCGVRIYGGVGRRERYEKHTLRLLFKRQYGPTKLRYPLFGEDATDEFDTIILRAGFNNSWHGVYNYGPQYIRDAWMCQSQLDMGQLGLHGTFVHLYINGLYWGLYNPVERCNADFGSSYLGADKEDYDALNSYPRNVVDGTADAWITAQSIANAGVADRAGYDALAQYVDIPNLIDYMMLNFYAGNSDWDDHNWYAVRRRAEGEGWKFLSWDAERVLESTTGANKTSTNRSNKPSRLYSALRENPEFRMQFADGVHRQFFNGGALTPEKTRERYKALADFVYRAIVGESARWGDSNRGTPCTRDNEWIAERDRLLNDYFPRRTDIVLGFLRGAGLYPNVDAPIFHINGSHQHGGEICSTDMLSMVASAGTIYYTIDGNDVRLAAEPLDTTSTLTLVVENAAKRVLVPTGPISDDWKGGGAFIDSAWSVCAGSPGGIGYERSSGYESYISLDLETQMYNGNATCYIRIPFTVNAADIAGFNFMRLQIRYDDGFIVYLNGTEVARRNFTGTPAWNSNASAQNSDSAAVSLENIDISAFVGDLKAGDNVLAIQGLNISTTSSDLLISVKLIAGVSTLINEVLSSSAIEYTGPITLAESTHVKTRVLSGATWSALNEATFAVGPVADNLRITEIMYNPQDTNDPNDPNEEFIELKNIGTQTLNLNLVHFTNGIDFTFPGMRLAAGEYVLVVRDVEAFAAQYGIEFNIAGEYSGVLNNGSERIELEDAAGRTILDFRYEDGWYDITDGMGFSLTVKDPASTDPNAWGDKRSWRPSANAGGSPCWDDTGQIPTLGELVINELLAHSHAGAPDWIELHNTTDAAISIGGWFLSDSPADFMKYEIAPGTTIEPYGYIVLYEDLDFGNPSNPGCHVPFALSENGETLYVHSGRDGVLTGYSDEETFGASQTGIAFGRYRKSTGTYNFVAMSENTPGLPNAYPKVGPIVMNEIMYNPASGDQDEEYIELYNISSSTITLAEYDNEQLIDVPWRLTDSDSISFDFPLGTTMAGGEYLLLVKEKDAFDRRYGVLAGDVQVLEWGDGRLDNGGEKVQLSKPGDQVEGKRYYVRVDRINYSDGSHPVGRDLWPSEPDGSGPSLTRKVPADYGNDVDNWKAAAPSPGE